MNYRIFCQEEWEALLGNFKNYSFGECMFAVMSCGKITDKKQLLSITDEEMHKLILKTIKKEKDEQ